MLERHRRSDCAAVIRRIGFGSRIPAQRRQILRVDLLGDQRRWDIRIAGVVEQVAAGLRNTPAVCRKSYINPVVFEAWRSGVIHNTFNGNLSFASPRKAETLVSNFLRNYERS